MQDRTIGFIGAGNMACALVKAILAAELVTPEQIMASDVSPDRLERCADRFGVEVSRDNGRVAAAADVLVLAVKPQVIHKVLPDIAEKMRPDTLVISIAAGVSIRALASKLPEGTRIVRTMPNMPAQVLAGATAVAGGEHASTTDLDTARKIFETLGRVVVLDEPLLDAATGLSGSGPAYVMLIIEALADGGVKVGLHRETALTLAAQTVYGAAKLLLESGEHPGRLKDMVTSPGGTAIAGLHTLESGGLRRTLMDAVENATNRATELGRQMDEKLVESGAGGLES